MKMTRMQQKLPQHIAAFAGQALRNRLGILASPVRDMRGAQRAVTIGLPLGDVREFFAAPGHLAQVLPDPSQVSAVGEDRPSAQPGDRTSWQVTPDPGLPAPGEEPQGDTPVLSWQVTGSDGARADITVRLQEAPPGLGTEAAMTVRYVSGGPAGPRPGGGNPASGDSQGPDDDSAPPPVSAAVLAVRTLRNARALLETGEIPTLRGNPAARPAGAPGGGQDAQEHQQAELGQQNASPDQPPTGNGV